ncbi:MAG: tetratricopeptide repeat protein, partial [Gammaproteobacteria bacterium]
MTLQTEFSELVTKAANEQDNLAKKKLFYEISICYELGIGCEVNLQKSKIYAQNCLTTPEFTLLLEAANNNDKEAQFIVGHIYHRGSKDINIDIAKAKDFFLTSANLGYAPAQFHLGRIYMQGEGDEKNTGKALEWLHKAADHGYVLAQFYLGLIYMKGEDVEKNTGKALEWLNKAADQEYATAQIYLGQVYANGVSVEKNVEKAVALFKHTIAQHKDSVSINCIRAGYYHLAEIYAAQEKQEDAIYCYKISAMQGFIPAQHKLGKLHMEGKIVPQDELIAIEWYKMAANQQNSDAQFNIAIIYEKGIGVPQDIAEAQKWLRLAAAQNHPFALYRLGRILVGDLYNRQPDVVQAVELFQRAAQHGNNLANLIIDQIIERVKNIHFPPKQANILQNVLKEGQDQTQQLRNKMLEIYGELNQVSNNPFTQNELGTMYEQNNIISNAIVWYQRAANNGYAPAQYAMVRMCSEGHYNIEENITTILKWIHDAANNNNEHLQAILGNIRQIIRHQLLLNDGDYQLGTAWNRETTKKQLLEQKKLFYDLGRRCEHGINCKEDVEKAYNYYEYAFANDGAKLLLQAAAKDNDREAQFIIGHIFYSRHLKYKNSLKTFFLEICYRNPEVDHAEAKIWYQRAADQGDIRAQNNLGHYENIERQYNKAIKWFQRAADQGHAQAQYNMGTLYENGEGYDSDIAKAVKYYKLAAAQGHKDALLRLGLIFDFKKHHQNIQKIIPALPTLWQYHDRDDTIPQYAEVVKWYGCAAEQGDADAAYRLGKIYAQGIGVEKNLEEAKKWYELADENGHEKAAQQLEAISDNMESGVVQSNVMEEEDAKRKRETTSVSTIGSNK